jgi:hypothetical protein
MRKRICVRRSVTPTRSRSSCPSSGRVFSTGSPTTSAFAHAEQVAKRTAEQLPGETVEAVAGEADVELAIRDALATFAADEIVVAVRPEDDQGIVESKASEGAPQRSVDGVPVRLVVISGS